MNLLLFQTIMTELLRKRKKGLVFSNKTHPYSTNQVDGENVIIYDEQMDDFYFIADKNTIPPEQYADIEINGVNIRVYKNLVRIAKVK